MSKRIVVVVVALFLSISVLASALIVQPALAVWRMHRDGQNHPGTSSSSYGPISNVILWKTECHPGESSPAVVSNGIFGGGIFDSYVYVGSNYIHIPEGVYPGGVYCLYADTGHVRWVRPLNGTVHSAPAVFRGRVFVGSTDGRITCLDASSGIIIWSFLTNETIFLSSPAFANSRVFIGSYKVGDGHVYCLDAMTNIPTGKLIWSYQTNDFIVSSPAVARVNTGTWGVYIGSGDGNVYCLDAMTNIPTGKLIWKSFIGKLVDTAPAVVSGRVYFGSHDQYVYCRDAATGAPIWRQFTYGIVDSSPAVDLIRQHVYAGSGDGHIYCFDLLGNPIWQHPTVANAVIGYSSPAVDRIGNIYIGDQGGNVYCLEPTGGNEIWKNNPTFGLVDSSPAIGNFRLYVGSFDGYLYCFYNPASQTCFAGQNGMTRVPDSSVYNKNYTAWSYPTGGDGIFASPAIVDGKAFVGSKGNTLYCLNASNGAEMWNRPLGGSIYSSPAVAYDTVFLGTNDGRIYCLNVTNGAPIWNYTTGNEVHSSPNVIDDKVYVGSDDHKIYCLNATTGILVWSSTTGDTIRSSPAVIDGKIYVGSGDSRLYCLNDTTGEQIWNYTTSGPIDSSPAVADDQVCFGSNDHNVYCLNATTGAFIWSYLTGGVVDSSPTIFFDSVYVESEDIDVAYSNIYIGSHDGKIYCLNATTGTQLWSYTTGGMIDSSPSVADDKVLIGSNDFKIYCLNATTGAYIWSYTTNGSVQSSPAVSGGIVYVGSDDGNFYALGNPHDIAITDLKPSKTVVGRGSSIFINLTVENQGELSEAFNVTFYANMTVLETEETILARDDYATLTLTWNTTGQAYGNYSISAYAWPVSGETNIANNNFTEITIHLSIPGDVKGDFIVNILDAILLSNAYLATPGRPNWNANADINGDGIVNILDAIILSNHYLQHYP